MSNITKTDKESFLTKVKGLTSSEFLLLILFFTIRVVANALGVSQDIPDEVWNNMAILAYGYAGMRVGGKMVLPQDNGVKHFHKKGILSSEYWSIVLYNVSAVACYYYNLMTDVAFWRELMVVVAAYALAWQLNKSSKTIKTNTKTDTE